MEPSEKKIKVQLKLVSKKGTRGIDGLMYIVEKLARYMRHRLMRLTSFKEPEQMMTRNLYIKFRLKHYPNSLSRLKSQARKRVQMNTDKLVAPFLHYWHEPTWNMFILRVVKSCSKIDRNTLKRTSYIAMEATNFIRCHIKRTEKKYDAKYVEEAMSDYKRACGEEFDPYMPVSEKNLELITGHPVRPRFKEQENTTPEKTCKIPSLTHGNFKRKLRQTRIDEYFKPRRVKMSS